MVNDDCTLITLQVAAERMSYVESQSLLEASTERIGERQHEQAEPTGLQSALVLPEPAESLEESAGSTHHIPEPLPVPPVTESEGVIQCAGLGE